MTARECAFCRIARGDDDGALVVLDRERTLAFLDHRPLFPGHALLIPRAHVETLADMPDDLLPGLFGDTRLLTRAIEHGLGADGSFVAINNRVSQSVPHLHVHLVPRRFKDGLRGFFWPRHRYEEGEAEGVAERLRAAVAALSDDGG